ncbi:hypothetical protein GOP47_0004325 [Adiantum capillus-veneris]|uniref:Sister chromatid cohesion protein PDS5 homolog A n=1 Tax=Adiantum capillus-veneris TaxID=13818 RepID=A0A9D4ZPG3_ADICA|nr:hypothetical protein GOP47_0004325 [Adiantum capillus-veneris]
MARPREGVDCNASVAVTVRRVGSGRLGLLPLVLSVLELHFRFPRVACYTSSGLIAHLQSKIQFCELAHPPHTKDAILKQLKQAADMLSEMKQSQDMTASIEPLTKALALPMIIKHKDKDVRLLATSCIMEVLRIVAPEAPYSDRELQDIFHEVGSAFEGLTETSNSSFSRRTTILEIMANLRICVVMLDVGCDDLITEMFRTFFSVVSDKHPPSAIAAMQSIMAAILEESEKIPVPILDMILNNLLKHKKGVSSAAHKLAVGVVRHCAEKLEPYVQRLLTSVMLEGRKAEIDLRADYHDIILEIYQCAPEMLLAVIPNLTQELVNDKVDLRLKAVRLLGRLFSLPGHHVAKEYRPLFLEFLKRFTDKATEVRLAMIDCAKDCLRAHPSGNEAAEVLAALDDRILDSEEATRLRTVMVVCELAKQNHSWVPISLLKHIAERLRDKKVGVRKEAFYRLADVYKAYATKCYEGSSSVDDQLEWIPGKLLRCCYDKDVKEFRPAGLELVFAEKLFPRQLSVSERARHWVAMYNFFEDIDKRALTKILLQKKRLQEDVSKILFLRQKEKETGQEQPEIQQLIKGMTLLFVDYSKIEEHFQKLYNMKDNKIFKALSDLLNPSTTFMESESILDDLTKRIGEQHPQHDFIRVLALRCSFIMFGKEHVKEVLQVSTGGTFSNETTVSGLSLIRDFAGVFSVLLENVKEEILALLLEGDDIIKDTVSEILARAGNSVFGEAGVSSSIELTLQKLCLEGTRKQAKHAVAALIAISADEGFKALSILFGRLVERLQEDNPQLPAILQSLGCIAQRAISIFETQEDDIVRFVVRSLLQKDSDTEKTGFESRDWDSSSKVCEPKIFGLKTLVKSFLPLKHHPRRRLRGLLNLLSKILPVGEIADTIRSSENDKAHLRLASVKGLLRLARRWDAQIPEPIFHLCVMMAQDSCINVRRGFLKKIHQYLKDRTLSHKYASAFALFAMETSKEILSEAKHHLNDFIEIARLEARTQQKSAASGTSIIAHSPEYVITYLVHVLAYHPSFPDLKSDNVDLYEPLYRFLLFFLRPLVHLDNDDTFKGGPENVPALLAIFRTIKKAEDALEGNRTANLHIICDIGIIITKELGSSSLYSDDYPGQIPLPSSLYQLKSDDADDVEKVDGSDLPVCLKDDDILSHLWHKSSRNGQLQLNPSSNTSVRKEKTVPTAVVVEDEGPGNVSGGTTEAPESEDEALDTPKSISPVIEDRVMRTRNKVTKHKDQGQTPTEHDQGSVSDKLRRSQRVLRGAAEVPSSGTRSTHPVSEGRVLRKRGVISDQQTKERALSGADKVNGPDSLSTVVIAVEMTKSTSPISEGRVLRKRGVTSDEQALPESKKIDASKSPRRSSRFSNGAGEPLGLEVLEKGKAKPAIVESEVKVLRKRSFVVEQQVQTQDSVESDEEETTVTWRSRRRKVQ